MVGERRWEGHQDLNPTDEMRLTIAGHASLMLLGTSDYYFQSVTTILIFPIMIKRSSNGLTMVSSGEAWQSGGVLLSWPEVLDNGLGRDGHNVVIHEFAHHLDGLDGEYNFLTGCSATCTGCVAVPQCEQDEIRVKLNTDAFCCQSDFRDLTLTLSFQNCHAATF